MSNNCAVIMNLKLELFEALGYPKEYIETYCPGEAPNQYIEKSKRIIYRYIETIEDILHTNCNDINTFYSDSLLCPYCRANKEGCVTCAWGEEFGICVEIDSAYHKAEKIEDNIIDRDKLLKLLSKLEIINANL